MPLDTKKLVEFVDVSIEARPPFDLGLNSFSCVFGAGELLAVHVADGYGHLPLADSAEGLIEPDKGQVLVLGEDWRSLAPGRAAGLRGRIGRVFHEHGWVSNLDMDENVTLSQRHHTLRAEEEIVAEARELASRFGLETLPTGRPGALKRADRRRTEWVRAFLGNPLLILLENPMRDVYSGALEGLVNEVKRARARGAGVVWLTSDPPTWKALSGIADRKLEQKGADLVPVKGV